MQRLLCSTFAEHVERDVSIPTYRTISTNGRRHCARSDNDRAKHLERGGRCVLLLGGKITGGSRPEFRGRGAMLFALACSHPFRLVRRVLNKRVQLLCGTMWQSRIKTCHRASLHLVMARNGNRKLLSQRYADYVADSRAFTSLERERERGGGRVRV